jgi:hypothetical protein
MAKTITTAGAMFGTIKLHKSVLHKQQQEGSNFTEVTGTF